MKRVWRINKKFNITNLKSYVRYNSTDCNFSFDQVHSSAWELRIDAKMNSDTTSKVLGYLEDYNFKLVDDLVVPNIVEDDWI